VAWPHPFFLHNWTPDSFYAGSPTPVPSVKVGVGEIKHGTESTAYYRVILFLDGNKLFTHLLLADMLPCDEVLELRELVTIHGPHRRIVVACVNVDV